VTPRVAELQALLDDSPFHGFLRMEVVALDPEARRLVLRLPFRPEYERGKDTGQVHGGPLASLVDIAGTFVMWGALGIPAPTVNLRVDYLRPTCGVGSLENLSGDPGQEHFADGITEMRIAIPES
jgi:acyl-coenzyme A thioesterase PaaI-like protein